jgi:hypothetical protein
MNIGLLTVVDKLGLQSASPRMCSYSFWTDTEQEPDFNAEIARLLEQHYDLIIA